MKLAVESPVLRRIRGGTRASVRRFWSHRQALGTPLIESAPGDLEHRRVTFLWRSSRDCDAAVLSVLDDFDWDRGRLERLAGTDIWYRSHHVGADVRTVYFFVDTPPPRRLTRPIDWLKYSLRWKRDPLNPLTFVFPADPEDPKDKEIVGSVLSLPKARPAASLGREVPAAFSRVELHRFRSPTLRNTRRIWIYRPRGSPQPASVASNLLIVFDGLAYLTLVPTPAILDRLQSQNRIGPTYAVLIDSLSHPDRSRELTCNDSFVRFLEGELRPWVERRLGRSFATARTVLVGSSLGGLAAAYAALQCPSQFGNVLSQSGAFWWSPAKEEPGLLAREYAVSPRSGVRFYLEAGTLETSSGRTRETPSILASNRHLRDVLQAKGHRVAYHEFAGGHDYLCWRDTLGPAIVDLLGRRRRSSVPPQSRTKQSP
ncbi:MAG: enterochelin esterase [Thermoplasmata archaeon]